jgi:hypothetical protein
MIRVVLPAPLQRLARVGREVEIAVRPPVTLGAVLDGLELTYPMLRGTLRDPVNGRRRAYIRFFACQEDWSDAATTAALPAAVAAGREPLLIIGSISGG